MADVKQLTQQKIHVVELRVFARHTFAVSAIYLWGVISAKIQVNDFVCLQV